MKTHKKAQLSRRNPTAMALGMALSVLSASTSQAVINLTDPLVKTAVKQVFGNAEWDPLRLEFTRPGVIIAQATHVTPAGGFGLYAVSDALTGDVVELYASLMDSHGAVRIAPGATGGHPVPHARYSYFHGFDLNNREVFGMGIPTTPMSSTIEWDAASIDFYAVHGSYTNPTGDQGLRAIPPNRFYPVQVTYQLADISMDPVTGAHNDVLRRKMARRVCQLDSTGQPQPVQLNLLENFTRLADYPIAIGSAKRRWRLDLKLDNFDGWFNPDTLALISELASHIAENSEWEVVLDYNVR